MLSYFTAVYFLKLLIILFVFSGVSVQSTWPKENAGWSGSASFAVRFFDSVHWFHSEGCFKDSPVIKYTLDGLFILMVNWNEEYSEPCKTSEVELLAELVNNWTR